MAIALTSMLSGLGGKTNTKPAENKPIEQEKKLTSILSDLGTKKPPTASKKLNSLQSILQGLTPVVKTTQAIDLKPQEPYVLNLDDFKVGLEVKHKNGLPMFIVEKRTRDKDGQVFIYKPSGDRYKVEDLLPIKPTTLTAIQNLILEDEWTDEHINEAVAMVESIANLICPRKCKDDFGNEWVLTSDDRDKTLRLMIKSWGDYAQQIGGKISLDTFDMLSGDIIAMINGEDYSDAISPLDVPEECYLSAKPLLEYVEKQSLKIKGKTNQVKFVKDFYDGFKAMSQITVIGRDGSIADVVDVNGVNRKVGISALCDRPLAYWQG